MGATTRRPLRLRANVTVEIEDFTDLGQALRDLLSQVLNIVVTTPPAPPPSPTPPPLQRVEPEFVAARQLSEEENLLLNSKQVAKLLDISERTLWGHSHSGRIPPPIKIGSAVRWSIIELREWVEAGCPTQEEWERRV